MKTLGKNYKELQRDESGVVKATAGKAKPPSDRNGTPGTGANPDLRKKLQLSWRLVRAVSEAKQGDRPIRFESGTLGMLSSGTLKELFEAGKRDLDKIENLLAEGAAPNLARDESWMTALMYAAMKNRYDIVEVLGRSGAEMNLTDGHGRTALDIVFESARECEMYWTLREKGAVGHKHGIY
jgi:ankyrin repeat protein